MKLGHIINNKNIKDENDSYNQNLPGGDHLDKHFSYFSTEHDFYKVHQSNETVKKPLCAALMRAHSCGRIRAVTWL